MVNEENNSTSIATTIARPDYPTISINAAAATNSRPGLVDGLSYGTYKIGTSINDSVLNDGGCSCAGALSLTYFKALKLNNSSLELLPSDLRLSSALDGPAGSLGVEGRAIIPTYDTNGNKS